jgi:hypothetical protein
MEIETRVATVLTHAGGLVSLHEVKGWVVCAGCKERVTTGHTMLTVLTMSSVWRTLLCTKCGLIFLRAYRAHIDLQEKSLQAWAEEAGP